MLLHVKKWLTIVIKTSLAYYALSAVSIVLATNWPIAPYCSLQSGPMFGLDWDEAYQNKISLEGISVSHSVGCLWSSLKLDNWLVSTEGYYHGVWSLNSSSFKEHGGFLVAKLAFPRSEGVESFLGLGVGGLYVTDLPEKNKKESYLMASLITTGLKWYLNKNAHLSLRGTWIKPIGDCARKQTISFGVGLHYHLI